jgi:VanZ family protein
VKFSKQAYWLLPLAWGVWIIYLSLLPGGAGILTLFGIPHFDKIAHLGAYAVWCFLFLFAAQKTLGYSKSRTWAIVGVLILVGCGLEFGQYYMHEGRSFEVMDMVANSLGSISGAFFERFLFKKKRE